MGESSVERPLPETVAGAFTNVYYKLAAQQPHRLAELYGEDSQLSHEPGTLATGLADIAASMHSLPFSKESAVDVRSIDAMRTGKGGYIVLVTGSVGSATFAQTFLLDPTGDDDSGKHFYCRNDVFRFVSPADAKLDTAADSLVPEHAVSVQVNVANVPNEQMKEATISPASPGVAASGSSKVRSDVDSTVPDMLDGAARDEDDEYEDGDADDDEEEDVANDDHIPDHEIVEANGKRHVVSETQIESAVTIDSHAIASVSEKPEADLSNLHANRTPDVTVQPQNMREVVPTNQNVEEHIDVDGSSRTVSLETDTTPKPVVPKSWASIVSSSTPLVPSVLTPNAAASLLAVASGSQTTSTWSDETTGSPGIVSGVTNVKSTVAAAVVSKSPNVPAGEDAVEGTAEAAALGAGSRAPGDGHGTATGGWSSVENKRHSYQADTSLGYKVMGRPADGHGHLNGHQQSHQNVSSGYQAKAPPIHRVYGPSAVIQLGNLPPERLRDWRVLVDDFSKEFAGYGFEIRNVDVKTNKGLAFVEYDTAEGVRAAVNAWADGPRESGPFKGIALAVSEKRQQRWHFTGKDRGGSAAGRGIVPRGVGRGMSGRGRGRGGSFAGGSASGQPDAHSGSSSAAALI